MKPIRLKYTAFLDLDYDLWIDEHAEEISSAIEPHEKALIKAIDGLELELPRIPRTAAPSKIKMKVAKRSAEDLAYVRRHSGSPELQNIGLPLRFSAEWNNVPDIIEDLSRTNRIQHWKVAERVCGTALEEVAQRICIGLSVYLPGFGDFTYGRGEPIPHPSEEFNFGLVGWSGKAAKALFHGNIPLTPSCTPKEFLSWLVEQTGFWTGLGQTNLDRVLNYFSHTFHRDSPAYSFENFMWVMAALEAAYCDTTAAIAEKLRGRATTLLPTLTNFFTEKRIGQLYEFRSKFLHGSMKVPNKFTDEADLSKDFYLFTFDDKISFATALLVKTLQAAADRNLREIRFVEHVDVAGTTVTGATATVH